MENPLISYYSQIILFSLFPFVFASIKTHFRTTLFYIYLGLVLGFGGFIGQIWAVQLADGIRISGGNIAYATFIMTSILFIAIERDIVVGRNIIILVIVVNLFKFFIFSSMSTFLSNPLLINPYAISPKVFSSSALIMTVGGTLIITELFLFIFAFEFIKKKIKSPNLNIAFFTICFVLILILDGILFPLINYKLFPQLTKVIIGGMKNKFVLGASFAPMMILFFIIYKNRFREYIKRSIKFEGLLERSREDLALTVQAKNKEVAKSEQRLSNLISNLPGIAYRCLDDDFWTMQYISDGCKVVTGYDPSELNLNKAISYNELIVPNDRQIVRDTIQEAVKDNNSFTIEYRILNKDGTVKWIWEKGRAVDVQNDGTKILEGFISDFTELKTTQIKLQEALLRRDEAVKAANVGLWDWDLEKNKVMFSDEYKNQIGYTPTEISNNFEEWESRVHPDDLKMTLNTINKNLDDGKKEHQAEFRFRHKNGFYKWILAQATIFRNEEGKPIKMVGSHIDITDNKLTQEQLSQFERIVNTSDDIIAIVNKDYQYTLVNQKYLEYYQTKKEDTVGKFVSELLGVGVFENTVKPILKKAFSGETVQFEGWFDYPDLDRRFMSVNYYPMVEKDGAINAVIGNIRDITENRKLQDNLIQSQKLESIGNLAGGIAHDFNNILFPIMGQTEMLLEDIPKDSPFHESLNEIYTGTIRAKDLVKQILTFSRQESSELKLMKMQPIIKEALKLIRSTIPSTIEIKHDIQTDCGAVKADPTQIHQVVMNLATNAHHAMEKTGGELKVILKKVELGEYDIITPDMIPGEYVCLIVSDTGTGMDKVTTKKIFDPFFTTKATGKGTGMGLSVIHGIVTRMSGAIQIHSKPGKGTQFHVYLPAEKSLSEEQVTNSNAEIQNGTEHILLVDDEEAILSMEKRLLERLGYQVTSQISSVEALEVFRANSNKFDLVITDMAMPNMSGEKLSAELIKINPDIPVLLCTGYSEIMSEEKASSMGIKGFLFKPIVLKDLSQNIRKILDLKKSKETN